MTPKLERFFAQLDRYDDQVPPEILQRELEALDITSEDVREYIRFGDAHYQRNRIRIGPGYHALALCWAPGQHSPIHDHRGSGCGVKAVQGEALETQYTRHDDGRLVPGPTRTLNPGDVCVSVDADIHRMGNDRDDLGLVTLHIYSPPLLEASVYSLEHPEVETWRDEIGEVMEGWQAPPGQPQPV